MSPAPAGAVSGDGSSWAFDQPVFVLCCGRSGSTLLRFLLDAHPDLACPPETNLPALCGQLATVWSLIEGAPLSANRGDEPPDIPDAAIDGIRHTMDMMVGSYLAQRGKKRYCDKSLGTATLAELLLRVYPEAKFICLYRHPMDVISSGLEACPWGLNGYGFDPYIATTPGNSVLAMARFWAENAGEINGAEKQFPDHCHRVRYEDLVADPEAVAAGIFGFLGVSPAPGISQVCFSRERERFGPGDHKIWYTSQISTDSVGRGWSVPAGLIAPPVAATINELAADLGYIPVDGGWGTSEPPADFRVSPGPSPASPAATAPPSGAVGRHPELGSRLAQGLAQADSRFFQRWEGCLDDTFVAIALPASPEEATARYRVSLGTGTVVPEGNPAGQPESDWDVIGSAEAWDRVLAGRVNVSVALRSCQLRYCDTGDSHPLATDRRISMLADLLGLTPWQATGARDLVSQPR
jgi:hypothetical protein